MSTTYPCVLITPSAEPNAKKPRLGSWNPSAQEVQAIQSGSTLRRCSGMQLPTLGFWAGSYPSHSSVNAFEGVRGCHNLGNTCFMNAILQAMVHNPILKFHFLSEQHTRSTCPKRDSHCMACQLDDVFHEVNLRGLDHLCLSRLTFGFRQFYSGETRPYGPSGFLHAMWMSQKQMAGYSQQDAHEFFISLANEIHNNCSSVYMYHLDTRHWVLNRNVPCRPRYLKSGLRLHHPSNLWRYTSVRRDLHILSTCIINF